MCRGEHFSSVIKFKSSVNRPSIQLHGAEVSRSKGCRHSPVSPIKIGCIYSETAVLLADVRRLPVKVAEASETVGRRVKAQSPIYQHASNDFSTVRKTAFCLWGYIIRASLRPDA